MDMKRSIIVCLLLAFSTILLKAQLKSINFSDFKERISNPESDTIYVVNFWATWCGPCVKELPEFSEAQDNHKDIEVKYLFVSLDFPGKEKDVFEFFQAKKIKGEVLMFIDTDSNLWIDKVKKDWQGNIPVTWFLKPAVGREYFHNGTISSKEILNQVQIINKEK